MEKYLIAHKVRGEPAFDIAEQMEVGDEIWWIIPTSGHRAYPYWSVPIDGLLVNQTADLKPFVVELTPPMPDDAIEHYEVSAAPKGKGSGTGGRDLLAMLGLVKPIEPMTRRGW